MTRARRFLALVFGALLAVRAVVACVVEPIDLSDRRCDDEHPCVEGYECVDGICELEGGNSSE